MTATTTKKVAYIFQEPTGWYVCDDDCGFLDARGAQYRSKNAAIASLRDLVNSRQTDYTHYRTFGSNPSKL
jgi:hypothetical protein